MQTAKLVTFRLIFKWTSHCAVIKEEQVCRDMLNECESSPREGINRQVVYKRGMRLNYDSFKLRELPSSAINEG